MLSQLLKQHTKNLKFEKPSTIHISFSRSTINIATIIGAFAVPSLSAQAYERVVAMSPDVADVVVARSGAGTVAELGVLGIPAVLVPYPFAGGHQRENARVLEQLHTAEIIEEKDLKGGILRDKIFSVLRKVSSRTEAQKALQKEIRLDAVTRLVDEVSRVFGS